MPADTALRKAARELIEAKVLSEGEDWITHGPHMVHAYGYAKAVEYMTTLLSALYRATKEPAK